jgi:hypothetical protein
MFILWIKRKLRARSHNLLVFLFFLDPGYGRNCFENVSVDENPLDPIMRLALEQHLR